MTITKRQAVFHHINAKWLVLCLLFCVLIFLSWSRLSSEVVDLFIPIDLGDIPEGLTIANPLPKGVEVRINGPKYLINALAYRKLRYTVDLKQVKIGDNFIRIQQSHIGIPEGLTINSVNPPLIAVSIEKEIYKELPVMVSVYGEPAAGFFVADAVARPSSVILRGPESALEPIEKVMTKPIEIKGLSEPLKKEIVLDLPEKLVVNSPKGTILAEIFIEEETVIKEFPDMPVEGIDSLFEYSIIPSTISIKVEGPVNILEKLHTENNIKAYVNLKTLKPGVYVRPAAITLPLKTTLVGVNPEIFTVTIKR